MCEFSVGDRIRPRCGIIFTVDSEINFNFLVDMFSFSIGLRVISNG